MIGWSKFICVTFLVLALFTGCSSKKVVSLPTLASFPTGSFANGDWSWEFKGDGAFVSSGPQGSETGTYSVTGDQVIITCQCCGAVEGIYTWSYDGTKLKFSAVDDKCSDRKNVVDASAWLLRK